ncbi:MAG: hypothetical protein R3F11_13390 [Verrucomicrobiales bacterium]
MKTEANNRTIIQNSPGYELAAAELRAAPPQEYAFEGAVLRDVLRLLASEAGISFFGLPENDAEKPNLVTFNVKLPPFVALETLAKQYGVALIYDNGIFYMRPTDDKELIARTYIVKYNTQEQLQTSGAGGGAGGASTSGAVGGGGTGPYGGGAIPLTAGGGGQGGSSGGGNIDLGLGGSQIFKNTGEALVEGIKEILGIKTNGWEALRAPDASVGQFGDLSVPGQRLIGAERLGGGGNESPENSPTVLWTSDSNTLFVVATRQQHQYVEAFLEAVDRPQELVSLEVKFFETSKDPRQQMGVNWAPTLDGGYNLSLTGDSEGGPFQTPVDLNRIGDTLLPETAVLSAAALNAKVHLLLKDRDTTSVSYPRVLTLNNREVAIRSVINQPVLAGSSSTTPGVGATTTTSIQYLPIGTTINVLPKIMADGDISLGLQIIVSNIIGSEFIAGNPYPVVSSRVYYAPLKVESGYTVAIAGLDEAFDSTSTNRVPVLGNIPVLGYLFKNKEKNRTKKNLMIFVTPKRMATDSAGLPDKPESIVPIRKEDPLRQPPLVKSGGGLASQAELSKAIAWADRELRTYEGIVRDNAAVLEDYKRINALIDQLYFMVEQINGWIEQTPPDMEELLDARFRLTNMIDRAEKIRRKVDDNIMNEPLIPFGQ